MPTLADLPSNAPVKIMLIGDPGTGKTGSITSLIEAGYELRIIDLDNGLVSLVQIMKHKKLDLSKVQFVSYRDEYKYREGKGYMPVGTPRAYKNVVAAMTKWPEDGTAPSEWGTSHVLVIDSLTMLGRAAYLFMQSLAPSARDRRQWFFAGQQALEDIIASIFSPEFKSNVVIISHITEIEMNNGTRKGYPSALGTALSKTIARYCNDLFVVETRGNGENVKRVIRTVPDGQTDAKTSMVNPPKFLPIETGLAEIFETLK